MRQGLFTLPAIYFADNNPGDDDINNIIATKEADPTIIDRLIRKIAESDAIEKSLEEARILFEGGRMELEKLPRSIYRDALSELAGKLVKREM